MTTDEIKLPELTCDVCHAEPARGVACVPGIPVSVAYGPNCIAAGAHPYELLVANTAMIGGYLNAASWWQEMVDKTLAHLGHAREDFDALVTVTAAEFEHEMAEADSVGVPAPDDPHPGNCVCPGCADWSAGFPATDKSGNPTRPAGETNG